MINKLIYFVIIIALFSCKNIKKEDDNGEDSQKIAQEKETSEIEKVVFNGSLKDWFRLGSREGYFFPLNIIDLEKTDTIRNVFLEYNFGVYLLRSSKLGLNLKVPLFSELSIHEKYPCESSKVFNYYWNEFRNSLMFKGRDRYLECRYILLNKDENVYQVFHEEIYQPNFETDTVITGLRIFTISLKEGTIEYELEGKFENEWY